MEEELYQCHGNHLDAIRPGEEIVDHLQDMIRRGRVYARSFMPVGFDGDERYATRTTSYVFGQSIFSQMAYMILTAYDKKRKCQTYVSSFPCMKGMGTDIVVDRVREWNNGMEATVYASYGDFDFAFFPVDYQTHKRFYRPGARLNVGLALLAMRCEEGQKGMDIEGDKAASLRQKMGMEPEYDGQGRPTPLHFGMEKLVAYVNPDDRCPDEAYFQSPTKRKESVALLDVDFWQTDVCLCRQERDGKEYERWVPLYFRKSFMPDFEEGQLLRGTVWMTARISPMSIEELTLRDEIARAHNTVEP